MDFVDPVLETQGEKINQKVDIRDIYRLDVRVGVVQRFD